MLWPGSSIEGVADSKCLTADTRTRLNIVIRREALCFGIGWADQAEIDALNILQATFLAMRRALLEMTLTSRITCSWMATGFLVCTDWVRC